MTVEIVQVLREQFPRVRLIGKCYTNEDRDRHGGYSEKWEEWFALDWFDQLEELNPLSEIESGYFGLMGCSEDFNTFQYWIGMMFAEGTPAPKGYQYVDLPESDVGVCWVKGKEETGEIYGERPHNLAIEQLKQHGMDQLCDDFSGADEKWWWFFERYNTPRFTNKQEDGTVILDYGVFIK
ncbi:hypothetical protein SAMN04488134_10847 [Amphibacillus marinus]|uniref:AraC family transcriptional regulator n=1 Tax=Amphibacillus marinus TaxID=872970 RepID=A0A1H8Q5B4_9BACI|nr:hypothetical protein [Amphibacillus marinus]SEO49410.1 hypothetical protein SAMN04488134_10847 [Amphibacillus marinus]